MENNEALLKALYRQDFYSFLRRVFAEVASNATFQSNWHIEVIIHYLQLAMDRERKTPHYQLTSKASKVHNLLCGFACVYFG